MTGAIRGSMAPRWRSPAFCAFRTPQLRRSRRCGSCKACPVSKPRTPQGAQLGSRPLSHAVRLWANILAGHLVLKVFAGFVPMMAAAGGVWVLGSVLPLVMTVALYALEFLVAFLQAYVFALLTCIYLNDALHPGH